MESMFRFFKAPRRYADTGRNESVCQLITGSPCGGFFDKSFTEVSVLDNVKPGEVVIVKLDDPLTIGRDVHTVALVWDDKVIESKARMDEGTTQSFPIREVKGQRLSVWLDADNIATLVSLVDASKAAEEVKRAENTPIDDLLDKLAKERKAQQDQMNNILFGVGVVVIIGFCAVAYALANTKLKLPEKVGLA